MPAKNLRLNITFDPAIVSILVTLAEQEHKSLSSLTRELLIEALEKREDLNLSALADIRDTRVQKTVSHEQAWK